MQGGAEDMKQNTVAYNYLHYTRWLSGYNEQAHMAVHSQVQKVYSPNIPKDKCISEVVGIGTIIILFI